MKKMYDKEYLSEFSNSYRLSNSKPSFTENIYINQKKKILEIMNTNRPVQEDHNDLDASDDKKYVIFNDINQSNKINWKYAIFDTDQIFNEDFPLIKSLWEDSDICQNSKGIEIRNLIFSSCELLNMKTMKIETYFDVILKGESCFWIFTRSLDELNKFSAIIKISKEDRSQKVFASFGTFIFDAKETMYFKIFLKQQLIDFSKTKNKFFQDNDLCEIKGNFIDSGDDRIRAKFFLNDSKFENCIDGDFFLPVYGKFKAMIAGTGQSTIVKCFYSKHLLKNEFDGKLTFSSEKRTCECCRII